MISSFSSTPLSDPELLLSEDRLASLAQTYERAASPVWIHNLQGECIYVNASARHRPAVGDAGTFDILDHHGRVIGRLRTA